MEERVRSMGLRAYANGDHDALQALSGDTLPPMQNGKTSAEYVVQNLEE